MFFGPYPASPRRTHLAYGITEFLMQRRLGCCLVVVLSAATQHANAQVTRHAATAPVIRLVHRSEVRTDEPLKAWILPQRIEPRINAQHRNRYVAGNFYQLLQ